MNKQRGFTLIELVIVIVILGILAAIAIPHFISVDSDARIAKLNGALGAMKSSAALAHSSSIVKGFAAGTSVVMEGTTVTMADHYPTADTAGILAASQMSATDFPTTGGGAAAGSTLTVTVSGGSSAATCAFTYTNPATDGIAPTFSVPVTTGC